MKSKAVSFFISLIILVCTSYNYGINKLRIYDNLSLDLNFTARGYVLNDQRIYWSGMEFSFGAEALISANLIKKMKWGEVSVETEIFLNQPFGKNVLTDEGRKQFYPNFNIDTFELSKLNIRLKTGKFTIKMGKALSPFGRSSFPVYSNNLKYGSPFIRSEAILWRETGVFINFKTGVFSFDIAAVNGEENRDTNSGKAGIFRLGFEGENWRIGASVKEHDGYGSEWQKLYKNHKGFDLMFKFSNIEFSAEAIWDRYGFHREFSSKDIFWPNSIYYRELFKGYKDPIKGFGWYSNIKFEIKKILINLNYGVYIPETIGNIYHDNTIKRFIIKVSFNPIKELSVFLTGVLENTKPEESWRQGAKGFAGLFGFAFKL